MKTKSTAYYRLGHLCYVHVIRLSYIDEVALSTPVKDMAHQLNLLCLFFLQLLAGRLAHAFPIVQAL